MKLKESSGYLAGLTLLLSLGFLVVWEFWLESFILVDYLKIEVHKNSMERWTFVVSCLSIVSLSLILPFKRMKATSDEMQSIKTALNAEQALSKIFFTVDNSVILVIDNSNRIMQINHKTSYLLGFSEEEMVGKDWIKLLVNDQAREAVKNQYAQFLADKSQNFIRFTCPIKAKNGSEKVIDWQCAPLKDERGKIYGSINSGQDLTEQIRIRNEVAHIRTKYEPQIKKLTEELNSNKQKYHNEAIKSANARARFKFWLDLENHLLGLSPEEMRNPETVKKGLKKTLQLFGELTHVTQGYVFHFTSDGSHMVNTSLWDSEDPDLESDPNEEISLDNFPWFKRKILNKETIHIPKISEMSKEASAEKEVYLSQNIKSIINAPILHNDLVIGYVGFESNQKEKTWDIDEIHVLKVIARLISKITHQEPLSASPADASSLNIDIDKEQIQEDTVRKERESDSSGPSLKIDEELKGAKNAAESELQQKLNEMEKARAKLVAELKERKQNEADLRASRDSIERQLGEKSLQLEKLLSETGEESSQPLEMEINLNPPASKDDFSNKTSKEFLNLSSEEMAKEYKAIKDTLQNKETELSNLRSQLKTKVGGLTASEKEDFLSKISKKESEITSLRKSFEEEKNAKTELQNKLKEINEALKDHGGEIGSMISAHQAMEEELQELRKIQGEFNSKDDQLQDTKQELESLEIANEQLMTDIEEKNFLIDEAKEKSARYEQMDLPLFTLDQEGVILTWNKTAASLTGYISELALEMPISFMFENKDDMDFEKEFLAPLRENQKHRIEVPIKKPNGSVFNALISLTAFKDRNDVLSTLGYMVNLSDAANEDEVVSIKRQFTTLLGNSGLLLANLSPDYLIRDFNEKLESTMEWDKEILPNKNFFEVLMPEENWEEVFSDIQGRIDTQASADLESHFMKDGTELTFLWNLVKEIDSKDNSVKGILAIGQDVTDLRNSQIEMQNYRENMERAQAELKDNQSLLNLMVDKAEDGLISIDEHGIIQSFNEGAEKLFGYGSQEITGKNVNQLMPEPYNKEHNNYIRNYIDTGNSDFVGGPPKELIGKHKDGTTFPIEITLRETYKEYHRMFIGVIRDIRKRKETQLQLIEIKEKYQRFMDTESAAVLVVDRDTQEILEYNSCAPYLYGYEPSEFKDLTFSNLTDTGHQPQNEDNPSGTLSFGTIQRNLSNYHIRKDGTIFPINISSSTFNLGDKEFELKIIRDITGEVESEEQLKERQEYFEETLKNKEIQLEEAVHEMENQKISFRQDKLKTVEHIVSCMVDLVNNPIQGIENILEQVKERAQMADIHKGLVTVAMNECRRVADLIGKLKYFEPPASEDLEPLDVHQVIDEIIQNNMDIIQDRTISLEKHYADDLPAIEAATQQIRQAIDNILKNAEESFDEEKGKITISTELDGSNVKIRIKDTGCGISAKDMDRIFDPFYTTKSEFHRPGLGLLASLGIVRNHKGEIDVDSRPGEGTTITVTLPLKQASDPKNNGEM